ncbi:MAG: hypothetical protein AAFW95_06730 [Cyanobacteria bacterium J06638_6]
MVLHDQQWQPDLRIGDILEVRGWVKRDVIEFFAEQWPQVTHGHRDQPIGYYLQQAGLLNSQQVQSLLQEQSQAGLRLGALAVLHGWLSQETLDWFLQSLAPEDYMSSAYIKRNQSHKANSDRGHQAHQARSDNPAARTQPNQQETVPMAPRPQTEVAAPPKVDDIPWVD